MSCASGATIGEFIAQEMYPGVKRADLSEEQRQTISSLSTLAAGLLAGSLTGDSSANVVADAQAGKNAAENNTLNSLGDIIGSQGAKYFEGAGTLEEQLSTDGSLTDQEKKAIRAHYRKGDLPEDVIKTILEKILGQIP